MCYYTVSRIITSEDPNFSGFLISPVELQLKSFSPGGPRRSLIFTTPPAMAYSISHEQAIIDRERLFAKLKEERGAYQGAQA